MSKVEVKTGAELISQIRSDAENSVPRESMEVKGLTARYISLINKEPAPAQSTLDRARGELVSAQTRLVGTLNIINFFTSLDEESHFDSIDPQEEQSV